VIRLMVGQYEISSLHFIYLHKSAFKMANS
jgi:hypothetical protein